MYNLIYKSNFKKSLQKIKKWNSNIFSKVWGVLERLYDWPPFEEIYNVHNLINFWQMLLFVIISPIVISYYKEIGLSLFIVLLDILISFIMWYILYKRGINLINLKNVN